MRKRLCITLLVGLITLAVAGCFAPKESPDVGKEIEQFGFIFTLPEGVTEHGMDGEFYDMDFGIPGFGRHAYISISPPESAAKTGVETDEDVLAWLGEMSALFAAYYDVAEERVLELRIIGGHSAGYLELDCIMDDLPSKYFMYMILLDDKLFSFTGQIFTNNATEETGAVIDDFIAAIKLA